jgi:hypothetical protein
MSFPVLGAIFKGRRKVSDIEFLAKKEFDGKLRTTEGSLATTGDIVTLTANTGKDMYKAKIKVVMTGGNNVTSDRGTVELKANGTIVETAVLAAPWDTGEGGSRTHIHEFVWAGKVAAGQILKLECVAITSNANFDGIIVVFEEDTGDDPRI